MFSPNPVSRRGTPCPFSIFARGVGASGKGCPGPQLPRERCGVGRVRTTVGVLQENREVKEKVYSFRSESLHLVVTVLGVGPPPPPLPGTRGTRHLPSTSGKLVVQVLDNPPPLPRYPCVLLPLHPLQRRDLPTVVHEVVEEVARSEVPGVERSEYFQVPAE